jgi:hypothetical protein
MSTETKRPGLDAYPKTTQTPSADVPGIQKSIFVGAYLPAGFKPSLVNVGVYQRLSPTERVEYDNAAREAHGLGFDTDE